LARRCRRIDVELGDFRAGAPVSPGPENGKCRTTPVAGITSPTWSADGATAAWQEPTGIWMGAMGAAPCQAEPANVIPGGSSPAFSVAPMLTDQPHYDPVVKTFDVKSKTKVVGKAKVGKKLKAKAAKLVPAASKVRYQWLRGKKAIKGATKATYQVTKKDRKHQLRVRTTSIRPGYKTVVTVSKAVRVKR